MPASKVSVLVDVMRTAVKAAPRAMLPVLVVCRVPLVSPKLPTSVHVFAVKFEITTLPENTLAAVDGCATTNPDEAAAVPTDEAPKILKILPYPDVVNVVEPVPSCTCTLFVADIDTL